jgi:DNA polymerase
MVSAVLDQARASGIAGILAELRAEVAACRICPAMQPFHKGGEAPLGTLQTGYMLVGEAPGRGTSEMLDAALAELDDPRFRTLGDLFFLADSVRCRPPHAKDAKKTRAPTRPECRNCAPYLHFEIRTLHPRLIVALGAKAAEAVLGRALKIEDEHGRRHHLGDVEVLTLIMPTPHNRASLKRLDMTVESYQRWLTGLFGALIDAAG